MQVSSLPPPPERARRILIVDDDEDRRRMLTRLLEREGYEIECLPDGADVFDRVHDSPPDLVLLDVMLPGLSGFEICADLKMAEAMKLTPIILMTSHAVDEESVVRGLMCGADDYVVTPSRLAELRARIRVQLRNRRTRELLEWARAQRASLKSAAFADALTGVANRRQVDLVVDETLDNGTAVILIMADIDHFKSINDTYGHAVGDKVLQQVAKAMAAHARGSDLVGRYGGEEFVVIVRGAKPVVAEAIAERYRNVVGTLTFAEGQGPKGVSISLGVSWDDGQGETRLSRSQLLAAADAALYEAKRSGRNRVVAATPEMFEASASTRSLRP